MHPPYHGPPTSLLILENDAEQLGPLIRLLTASGYLATPARSVAEASSLLEAHSFDAVVSDYELVDGYVTRLVRGGLVAQGRLIITSGHPRTRLLQPLFWLRKPLFLGEVLQALDVLFEGIPTPFSTEHVAVILVSKEAPEPTQVEREFLAMTDRFGVDKEARRILPACYTGLPLTLASALCAPCLLRLSPGPPTWLPWQGGQGHAVTSFLGKCDVPTGRPERMSCHSRLRRRAGSRAPRGRERGPNPRGSDHG